LTYNALGRPKEVRYWVATARSNEPFMPNDEVDEIQWLPVAQARHRLTYEHDADTVEAAAALQPTVPLIFLRHAQAVKRADFKGAHDASRPLTSKGKSQAKTLASLLNAFAIESVHSSDAARCLETVKALAKLLGTDVQQERDLSESGFEQDEKSARERMKQLSLHSQATVICSHRPVLPALLDVLTSALDLDVDPSVLDAKLSPGSFLVVHRVFHEDERPRVVAVERHNAAEG
jgi:8-oxo-dGTP diphosphatase